MWSHTKNKKWLESISFASLHPILYMLFSIQVKIWQNNSKWHKRAFEKNSLVNPSLHLYNVSLIRSRGWVNQENYIRDMS